MNIWIVYSPFGWHVYDFLGNFLGTHGFMCDCKGHAMRLGVSFVIISERSSLYDLFLYYSATGKIYVHPQGQNNCDQWWDS